MNLHDYMGRELLLNVSIALAGVILVFMTAELYLVFGKGIEPGVYPKVEVCDPGENVTRPLGDDYIFNPVYGWKGIPDRQVLRKMTVYDDRDLYTHNSRGFRDTYDTGNRSIVVLGDSMTYGWLADDNSTYPHLLDRWSPGTSFHNLGHPGYGTAQQMLLYQEVSDEYDHDLVIVGYMGNDPFDSRGVVPPGELSELHPRFEVSGGKLVQVQNPSYTGRDSAREIDNRVEDGPQRLLMQNSAFFTYVQPEAARFMGFGNFSASRYSGVEDLEDWPALTRSLVNGIADTAERQEAEVLLVAIPSKKVTGSREDREAEVLRHDGDFWRSQKDLLRNVSRNRESVYFLDLEPPIEREIDRGKSLYGRRDSHLDESGYRVAATQIHLWLQREGYLSEDAAVGDRDYSRDFSGCTGG